MVRIEQLFPLHLDKLQQIIDRYPNVEEYIWAQEEPKNMGAWSFMLERLELVKLNVRSRNIMQSQQRVLAHDLKNDIKAVIDSVFATK